LSLGFFHNDASSAYLLTYARAGITLFRAMCTGDRSKESALRICAERGQWPPSRESCPRQRRLRPVVAGRSTTRSRGLNAPVSARWKSRSHLDLYTNGSASRSHRTPCDTTGPCEWNGANKNCGGPSGVEY
jgi:hypothetical protein